MLKWSYHNNHDISVQSTNPNHKLNRFIKKSFNKQHISSNKPETLYFSIKKILSNFGNNSLVKLQTDQENKIEKCKSVHRIKLFIPKLRPLFDSQENREKNERKCQFWKLKASCARLFRENQIFNSLVQKESYEINRPKN